MPLKGAPQLCSTRGQGRLIEAMEQAVLASSDVANLETGGWRVKAAIIKLFELQKKDRTKTGTCGLLCIAHRPLSPEAPLPPPHPLPNRV